MNYRHAFHAGNHADCLKHWVLALCLRRLTQKPAPLAVLDTHAGIGRYDLTAPEATRSPEWRQGIARLWGQDLAHLEAPAEAAPYLEAVRAENASGMLERYPGSPALCLSLLRAADRYIGCELHPEDAATLRRAIGADRRAQVHERDGFEAVSALTPFAERRGLIVIDPPFEDRAADLARSVAVIKGGVSRFRQAVWLWWRPLITPSELARADAELRQLGLEMLRADLDVDAPKGLSASSVLLLNPPFGTASSLAGGGGALAARLAQGPGARFSLM